MKTILLLLTFTMSCIPLMSQHRLVLTPDFNIKSKVLTIKFKNTISNDVVFRQERQQYDGSGIIEIFAYDKRDSLLGNVRANYTNDFPIIFKEGETKIYTKELIFLKTYIPQYEQIEKIKLRFNVHNNLIREKPEKSERYVKEVEYDWK